MCTLVVHKSQANKTVSHDITIAQFWSREGDWSPDCFFGANITIGQQECQLQVFPAGCKSDQLSEKKNDEATAMNEGEDYVVIEEIVDEKIETVKDSDESCDTETEEGMCLSVSVALVNKSSIDLIIDGKWSIGLAERIVKCEQLPRLGRIALLDIGSGQNEKMKFSRTGDDLEIVLELSAYPAVVHPAPADDEAVDMKALLERIKSDMSEVQEKVKDVCPMLAELRDQFQSGMESMQDILLETPLCGEVIEMKKDVGLMKVELIAHMKAELNAQEQSGKAELFQLVSTEVSAAIRRELSAVQESSKRDQTQASDLIGEMKQEIMNSVFWLKDSLGAGSSSPNLSAISEVKLQLEMLQDSVLTAVSSPPPVHKPAYPECPYCMEELAPPAQILQCLSGHLICQSCRAKPAIRDCPSCHQQFSGRNRGLESFLQKLAEG